MKKALLYLADASCLVVAFVLAFACRYDFNLAAHIDYRHATNVLLVTLCSFTMMYFLLNIHRIVWRYTSLTDLVRLSFFVFCMGAVSAMISALVFSVHYISISIIPLQGLFCLIGLLLLRGGYLLYRGVHLSRDKVQQVLVIGAGEAGSRLVTDMLKNKQVRCHPIGLLDDDPRLQDRFIRGVKVLGTTSTLGAVLAERDDVDMVIIAIPSLSEQRVVTEIYSICDQYGKAVRILPGLQQLSEGRVSVDALRDVSIEDLLGRELVTLYNQTLSQAIADQVVLVTGGGGSIGSELCRQLAANQPKALIVVENSEFNLYQIERQIKTDYSDITVVALLVDVADPVEVEKVLRNYQPNVIFHASAYKHVPLLETQLLAAVKNNVMATKNLVDQAHACGVRHFVLVSSDKAVNPANVMGMTKRIAEIYCQYKNRDSDTAYSVVRFGNVLGSSGSVLPLFREQLKRGGALTVTHPNMVRYFMMIPEAVSLILQSYTMGSGGQIFVLDMGEPVRILALAEKLISLSGKVPYQDVAISITGARPGEKLFEELFYSAETMRATSNKRIFESTADEAIPSAVEALLQDMFFFYREKQETRLWQVMQDLVPGYSNGLAKSNELQRDNAICLD